MASTEDHVRDLLRRGAAGAPGVDAVDVERVAGRIRRGRAVWVGGAAVAVVVVVGGAVAVTGLVGDGLGGHGARQTPAAVAACPDRSVDVGANDTALVLTASRVGAESVTVVLANTGAAPVNGVTAAAPDLEVATVDGVVVARSEAVRDVGVDLELGPNGQREFTARIRRCDQPSPSSDGKESVEPPEVLPLPPGEYRVTARISVQSTDSGSLSTVTGGPWPLSVP